MVSRLTENRPKTEVFKKTETETDVGFTKTEINRKPTKKPKKTIISVFRASLHILSIYPIYSFLEEPNEAEDANPFTWWQVNQLKYPTLAVVARSSLAIPSTSVASERVFSKCGRVCSERRSLLSPEHVEQLVFLSQNIST